MVVISHCVPHVLSAYSTSPLTLDMRRSVEHGFWDGAGGRFGNPSVVVNIHDGAEYHGLSHYDLRLALDNEGMRDTFVVIDAQTPHLDAVWFVKTTEDCKRGSDPSQFRPGDAPRRYPGEDFVLWHAHMTTGDVPVSWASWEVAGCGSMQEALSAKYWPYDPHDPQEEILSLGVDWKDPKTVASWAGYAYLGANYSEVEWSADPDDCRGMSPVPPVVVRLTADAARENGLLQSWFPEHRPPVKGKEIRFAQNYDWESPVWPTGYPDDLSTLVRAGTLRSPGVFRPRPNVGICANQQMPYRSSCARFGDVVRKQGSRSSSRRKRIAV
ncbi:MAG: hypothetical protein Q9219_004521 [cf. Caloplaca sp. 3 TL-2023]